MLTSAVSRDERGCRPGWLACVPALAIVATLAVPVAAGCAAEPERQERSSLRTDEQRARRLFESDAFARRVEPQARPDQELLQIQLIRVSSSTNRQDAQDIGYIREERVVHVMPDRPWDADDSTTFSVRTDSVFPHPVRQADGSYRYYQAIERRQTTVLDLAGNPVGTIDESGNVYRFDPVTQQLVPVGAGSPQAAMRMLFDLHERGHIDEDTQVAVISRPDVFFVRLDGRTAQARRDTAVSMGLVLRGRERVGEDEFADAMADFNLAVERDAFNPQAYFERGNLHRVMGNHREAVSDYDRAVNLDSSMWEAWLRRAISLTHLGNRRDARESIDRAFEHAPDDAKGTVRLTQEQLDLGS